MYLEFCKLCCCLKFNDSAYGSISNKSKPGLNMCQNGSKKIGNLKQLSPLYYFSFFCEQNNIVGTVVYFDQLSGAASTWKLVEILFFAVFNLFCSFQSFVSDFKAEINKNRLKMNKESWKRLKKSISTSFQVLQAQQETTKAHAPSWTA